MNFYMLPTSNYSVIDNIDVLNLVDTIKYLKGSYEKFKIPIKFFETKDINGATFYDLLALKNLSSAQKLLIATLRTQSTSTKTYGDIQNSKEEFGYIVLKEKEKLKNLEDICIYHSQKQLCDDQCIASDITKMKRYYLEKNCQNFEEYKKRALTCFPDLIFLEDSFSKINKIGKFKEVKKELTRHLITLNDVGNKLYQKYGESEAYKYLDSKWNIKCSGKGRKDDFRYKKQIIYNYKSIIINYQPHTKLFNSHNEKRIYFCWGNKDIENGDKIIVVLINGHL